MIINKEYINKLLFNNILKHKNVMFFYIIIKIIKSLLMIFKIRFLSLIILNCIKNKIDIVYIKNVILILIFINILKIIFNIIELKFKIIFFNKIKNNLKNYLLKKINFYILNNKNNFNISKITVLIKNNIKNIHDFYYTYIPIYYSSLIKSILIIINIFIYEKFSIIFFTISIVIIIIFMNLLKENILINNNNYINNITKTSNFFLNKLYLIKISRILYKYKNEYFEIKKKINKLSKKTFHIIKFYFIISNLINIILSTSIYSLLIYILYKNIYLLKNKIYYKYFLIDVILLISRLFYEILNINKTYHIKVNTINSLSKIFKLFNKNLKTIKKKIIFSNIKNIIIKNLSIKNNENNIIFGPISLKISKNDLIILHGNKGSGKTLFIKTLLGLYDKYTGSIKYNNINIKYIKTDNILKKISWINNELNFNYYYSIKKLINNIKNNDLKLFNKFVKKFKIEKILNKLKNKYNILSNGELQILYIFISLIKKSDLIFIDNFNNNLDIKNTNLVNNELKKIFNKKTLIILTNNAIKNINLNKLIKIKSCNITIYIKKFNKL